MLGHVALRLLGHVALRLLGHVALRSLGLDQEPDQDQDQDQKICIWKVPERSVLLFISSPPKDFFHQRYSNPSFGYH